MRNPAFFLHEVAAAELKDRLNIVNKCFTKTLVVSRFPEFWHSFREDAQVIPPTQTLPLEEAQLDLAIHAMSLHWADDPVGQLIQIRRALRPDGLFLGIFFGGRTLHELRSAFAQAESDLTGGLAPRVVPMGDIRDLGALLQRAGFALPVADIVPLTVTYADLLLLMRDLRAMGETNAMEARLRRFSRRDVFLKAAEIYSEANPSDDKRISATFELAVLTGWSPGPDQPQPLRPGSATSSLAEALGTDEFPLKD